MDKPRTGEVIIGLLFPLLLAGFLLFAFFQREALYGIFSSPKTFASWVDQQRGAPFVFMGIQFFQVLVFIIPGEIPQVAGGYLFGVPLGLFYSLVGITAGSLMNFLIGRLLGTPFVKIVIGEERFDRFSHLLSSPKALTGFFLFFLAPGFPKDALCYIAGLSPISLIPFFVITMLGRFPALLTSVMAGSAAAKGEWTLLLAVVVFVVVAAGLGFIYRTRLKLMIDRIVHH